MDFIIKMENIKKENAVSLLLSSKKTDKIKGAKIISGNKIEGVCDVLYEVFLSCKEQPKNWDLQCELIRAAGVSKCYVFLNDLEYICQKKLSYDTLTIRASEAYVRLRRKDSTDVEVDLELFQGGIFSIIAGVLNILGKDKIIPSIENQKRFIEIASKMDLSCFESGYHDPTIGLVIAAAQWDKTVVSGFLLEKSRSSWSAIAVAAEMALNGKYYKNWG
jgi:hypothetical protein